MSNLGNLGKMFFLILFLMTQSLYAEKFNFTVLHTNDLHSHFTGNGPDHYVDTNTTLIGHYARLSGLINRERQQALLKDHEPVLLLDAGDFFSGSLFHILGPLSSSISKTAPELEFFAYNKYDAITLGNHEFDAGEAGLMNMLQKHPMPAPHLLTTNLLEIEKYNKKAHTNSPSPLFEKSHLFQLSIPKSNKKLNVGIVGILGDSANFASKSNRDLMDFASKDELIALLQEEIDQLRHKQGAEQKAQVIIVLAHAGTPEDESISKKLHGVDLFIAGHTHEFYLPPKNINNTIIVQSGSFGKNLGRLKLSYDTETQKISLRPSPGPASNKGHLIPINNEAPFDSLYNKKMESYKKEMVSIFKLQKSHYQFDYDTPIYTAIKNMPKDFFVPRCELGVFVTSAILKELNRYALPGTPIDVYLTSLSFIREGISLYQEKPTILQFSDIFRLHSVGFDHNGNPGSRVVSFYLTKWDLKLLLNLAHTYTYVQPYFNIAVSETLDYEKKSGLLALPFFNGYSKLILYGKEYADWPTLIHVATTENILYYIQHEVKSLSYGLLSISTRDASGREISDIPEQHYPKTFELLAAGLQYPSDVVYRKSIQTKSEPKLESKSEESHSDATSQESVQH